MKVRETCQICSKAIHTEIDYLCNICLDINDDGSVIDNDYNRDLSLDGDYKDENSEYHKYNADL